MIMVTGGAGYIGSHTCVELMNAGHRILIVDNFCNSSRGSIRQLEAICNRPVVICEGDVRDSALLEQLMRRHHITAVVHFAGLKAVGDSVAHPISYYDNNVTGT